MSDQNVRAPRPRSQIIPTAYCRPAVAKSTFAHISHAHMLTVIHLSLGICFVFLPPAVLARVFSQS